MNIKELKDLIYSTDFIVEIEQKSAEEINKIKQRAIRHRNLLSVIEGTLADLNNEVTL